MSFRAERRVFNRLRNDCPKDAKEEYEDALQILVQRYNTTIRENRFTVGGVVEVFTCALLRSVGIECTMYADQSDEGDILLHSAKNPIKLSIKSQFTSRLSPIKLMNKLGGGTREWSTATLFVIANIGIIYGTPDMVDEEHVRDTKDGLELRTAGLKQIISNDTNIFSVVVPQKPPTEMTGFSSKASTALAQQILSETQSKRLLRLMGTSSH